MPLRRHDGATLWAALHLSPLPGEGGAGLIQIVETSRCRDLEVSLALAQRREALGQLTNGVAHEFNNLLQILVATSTACAGASASIRTPSCSAR